MAIPTSTKTTIDNLPSSVSQQYAKNDLAIKESPFYQDISRVTGQTSPQVAVIQPAIESQLDNLTGSLSKKNSVALYTEPKTDLGSSIFSYSVFPALTSKDTPLYLDNLERIKNPETVSKVTPIENAIRLLGQLNKMSMDINSSCNVLKRG